MTGPQTPIEYDVASQFQRSDGDTPLDPLDGIAKRVERFSARLAEQLNEPLVGGQPKRRVRLLQLLRQRRLACAGQATGHEQHRHGATH